MSPEAPRLSSWVLVSLPGLGIQPLEAVLNFKGGMLAFRDRQVLGRLLGRHLFGIIEATPRPSETVGES